MEPDLTQMIAVLERTPPALKALLSGLPDAWLDSNEGDDTFSPRDVVGHLLYGEATDWMARTEIILDHGTERPFDPFDRFIFVEKYRGWSIERLLSGFEAARTSNLARLESLRLDRTALEKEGRHPELGSVPLGQLLSAWVVHDLSHLRQIARVMAKQYAEAVGPWRQYLPVLDE